MQKLRYWVILAGLSFLIGCQPEGQQIDTAAVGADPGKEKVEKDKESGNDMSGPTKALTD